MTTVSMDHTPAEKFTLTSFSWGGSHIYCALASARPKISDELWRDSVAGCPTATAPAG